MKKLLIITLTDGTVHEIDLVQYIFEAKVPLNTPSHSPYFLEFARVIAQGGFELRATSTADYTEWVPPSRIAKLEIDFRTKK